MIALLLSFSFKINQKFSFYSVLEHNRILYNCISTQASATFELRRLLCSFTPDNVPLLLVNKELSHLNLKEMRSFLEVLLLAVYHSLPEEHYYRHHTSVWKFQQCKIKSVVVMFAELMMRPNNLITRNSSKDKNRQIGLHLQ